MTKKKKTKLKVIKEMKESPKLTKTIKETLLAKLDDVLVDVNALYETGLIDTQIDANVLASRVTKAKDAVKLILRT